MQIALAEAIDAEPTLPIANHMIHFMFGPLLFPKDSLPAKARRVLVRALLDYLRAGRFVDGPILGHPVLEAFGMSASIYDGGPAVDIGAPACCFSPTGRLNAAIQRVRLKIERAAKYDQRYPLWLFLHITDTMGDFGETVKRFGKVDGPIVPFEAVFLSDGRSISVLRSPAAAVA